MTNKKEKRDQLYPQYIDDVTSEGFGKESLHLEEYKEREKVQIRCPLGHESEVKLIGYRGILGLINALYVCGVCGIVFDKTITQIYTARVLKVKNDQDQRIIDL